MARAEAAPSRPAVLYRGAQVNYGELWDRARRFASAFAGGDEPRVLIALPQGADAYAAMFAAGLAGGYYVPVNISAPVDKFIRIVRAAEPDVVVVDPVETPAGLLDAIGEAAPAARRVDVTIARAAPPFEGSGRRSSIAYLIFTSGSTGDPKGVVIPRAGLEHYVAWAIETLGFAPEDRISQHPNIGFDLSVLEIYGALCSGAALCPVAGPGDRLMPGRLIADLGVTVWISVPSVVGVIVKARHAIPAYLKSLRLLFFCGESLRPAHLDAIFAACPGARVVNAYGPTEATVSMTYLPLRADSDAEARAASVALGEPIPGMGLRLAGGPSPDEGEIVITGEQLALGYWRDPEQTARSFREFEEDGKTLRGYFSGDWAARRGKFLFFKERIDHQVKINGFRVELDEVAAAIRACGWPAACVVKRGDALAAVVEARPGVEFDPLELRAALAVRIEAYALPAEIRVIAAMPRNANDKLDRDAVARLFDAEGGADARS
jgi:D-alanine--poly(phosphoribitol) ligase subunit 1